MDAIDLELPYSVDQQIATASKVPIAVHKTSADEHFADFGEFSVFSLVDVILIWLLACREP